MFHYLSAIWNVISKFRDYRPKPVTPLSLWNWLNQFPPELRLPLLNLLNHIEYISEREIESLLIKSNNEVTKRLSRDGIGPDKIVYVQIDDAGSSSPVMLNLLRDAARLERQNAKFADSKDIINLTSITRKIGTGAIVYVDDFAGSGRQFVRNRDHVAQYILGNFAEFFIAPCMCEEALIRIAPTRVIPLPGTIHKINNRPLHKDVDILDPIQKNKIVDLCQEINPRAGLGFDNLATMVVLFRSSPNTMPLVFRGSLEQNPFVGLFPRPRDLPI